MRPLLLRMSNLRSYRSEVTVDFGDPGLIAIVGDTGAGKSSILEALFFVLYGGCTWDQRAVVPLISDGAMVMQVELVFLADGRKWRVFRSASRGGGQSRHELECLDDPAVRFDNDGPVTDEIKRLVGLDRDAFLRTVILPQGRFQALLQATRGDRTAILKGIFRLDQLAVIREHADAAARRVRPGIQKLREQRAQLLPDPHASLADARQRSDEAGERQAFLNELSEKISVAAAELDTAKRQGEDLQAREQRASATAVPSASSELTQLAAEASRLERQRRNLDADRNQRRQAASSLAESLARADDQGQGIQALASASATAKSLAEQLPRLIDDEASCERDVGDLDLLTRKASTRQTEAAALNMQATDANEEQNRLVAAEAAARDLLTEIKALLATMRSRAATFTQRQGLALEAAAREEGARDAIPAAQEQSRSRVRDRDAARLALEKLQRAHAAAHAAEECEPGDPCPICRRPLPAEFHRPAPPGEERARERLHAAEHEMDKAGEELARRQADLMSTARDRQQADQDAQQAKEELDTAIAELRLVRADIDIDAEDETLLAPFARESQTAKARRADHAVMASALAQQAATATAEANLLGNQVRERSSEMQARQESIRRSRAALDTAAGRLPGPYRVGVPVTAKALTAAAERIDQRLAELTETSERLDAAQRAIEEITAHIEALTEQVHIEINDPAQRIIINLATAGQRLDDLVASLGLPATRSRPEGNLADTAEWARELTDATNVALARAQAVIASLRQRQDQAASVISDALAAAGTDDEQGLQQAISETLASLQRAKEDIRIATEQIPRVKDLATKISQGEGLLAALDELTRLLADGKFIAYVVLHKQQTLLAIASEILGAMTGGRYGFSQAFEIVDRITNLPRGVKTLSGGETFLASLALALGLVDLAGRGGGRLDALFLDEGFGSLDANSLAEALDALGRQAEDGRLVVVISHLRSVAEAMDRVLAVSTGASGSQVRWLGGDERDQLITEDVEASLLA